MSTFSRVLYHSTAARRAMMLGYPPVTVAPDEYPGHSTWTEPVAIGKINVACGDCNIRGDLPNSRHGVGFHTYAVAYSNPAGAAILSTGQPSVPDELARGGDLGLVHIAGSIFWFSRNKFFGSKRNLSFWRRLYFSAP